jgi:hypothetical protein
VAQYATQFLVGLSDKRRAKYKKLIEARKAYLEHNGEGSQLLIIPNPKRKVEDIFARQPDAAKATCIGKRVR